MTERGRRGVEGWRCYRNVDLGGRVLATLDSLTTALYVQIDDFLPARRGPGHPPKLSDSETITLAVCQMLMGLPNDRQFLALADGMPIRYELFPASTGERDGAARCSKDSTCTGTRCSPTRASPVRSSSSSWLACTPTSSARTAATRSHASDRSARCASGSNRSSGPARAPLALERHGACTDEGLAARVALRLLALAAALWHNQLIGQPARHLAAYNH
jgi:hypothetical protein